MSYHDMLIDFYANGSQWDINLIIYEIEALNLNKPDSCFIRINLYLKKRSIFISAETMVN